MPLDCDDMRSHVAELHEVAAKRLERAVSRGRYAVDYVADMTKVVQVETAAEMLEKRITEDCP